MRILFYTQFSSRSRDTESVMQAMVKEGHEVFLLTQTAEGAYHEACRALGVKTFSHTVSGGTASAALKQASFLRRFCKEHNIGVVFAHLEKAGLAAVLAQYFMKAKVVVCRHIVDEAYLFGNKNFIRLNKLVYTLAKNIIVVSQRSKDFMVAREKINPGKIKVINLAYNFELYDAPDPEKVKNIRDSFQCSLLVVTACRLVKPKRPDVSIKVVHALIKQGLDVKLLISGTGPEEQSLRNLIAELKLSDRVFLPGHVSNMMDYLSAADVLLHPSILDSSSVIIKEAGLLEKPVITCRDVGDVNDYLVNGKNAFLVSRDNPEPEMAEALKALYGNRSLAEVGKELKTDVIKRFSISTIIRQYDNYLK